MGAGEMPQHERATAYHRGAMPFLAPADLLPLARRRIRAGGAPPAGNSSEEALDLPL